MSNEPIRKVTSDAHSGPALGPLATPRADLAADAELVLAVVRRIERALFDEYAVPPMQRLGRLIGELAADVAEARLSFELDREYGARATDMEALLDRLAARVSSMQAIADAGPAGPQSHATPTERPAAAGPTPVPTVRQVVSLLDQAVDWGAADPEPFEPPPGRPPSLARLEAMVEALTASPASAAATDNMPDDPDGDLEKESEESTAPDWAAAMANDTPMEWAAPEEPKPAEAHAREGGIAPDQDSQSQPSRSHASLADVSPIDNAEVDLAWTRLSESGAAEAEAVDNASDQPGEEPALTVEPDSAMAAGLVAQEVVPPEVAADEIEPEPDEGKHAEQVAGEADSASAEPSAAEPVAPPLEAEAEGANPGAADADRPQEDDAPPDAIPAVIGNASAIEADDTEADDIEADMSADIGASGMEAAPEDGTAAQVPSAEQVDPEPLAEPQPPDEPVLEAAAEQPIEDDPVTTADAAEPKVAEAGTDDSREAATPPPQADPRERELLASFAYIEAMPYLPPEIGTAVIFTAGIGKGNEPAVAQSHGRNQTEAAGAAADMANALSWSRMIRLDVSSLTTLEARRLVVGFSSAASEPAIEETPAEDDRPARLPSDALPSAKPSTDRDPLAPLARLSPAETLALFS